MEWPEIGRALEKIKSEEIKLEEIKLEEIKNGNVSQGKPGGTFFCLIYDLKGGCQGAIAPWHYEKVFNKSIFIDLFRIYE